MEYSTRLDRLPADLTFPDDLAGRIRFDASTARLSFRGFMSKADFDRLYALGDDWPYRRALEDLFRLCVSEDAPPPRGLRRLAGALMSLGLV